MKIAVYYNISFSGAKRVVKEHVGGLKSLGHSVDVYTTNTLSDIFSPELVSDNNYIYKFNPIDLNIPLVSRLKKDFIDTFFLLRRLHKKIAIDIDKRNYNLVLVHTDINTQSPFLLRYLKTKNVYYCLEPLRNAYEYALRINENIFFIKKYYENINRWIRKSIDRKNVLSAHNIIALSLFGRERIISAYDLYPKISYLGVNELIFKNNNIQKKNYVLFIAGKESIYGYDLAKKAMQLIPKKFNIELKIVSWKKDNSQRLIDSELVELYNQSIFTLSLSKYDTFGLVALESMACGIPVIALNVAGYRETILDDKTGYLVDFDHKQIASKMIYLLNNPNKTKEMGAYARKWIENEWTWSAQIKKLEEILKDL